MTMTTTAHTPGPWTVSEPTGAYIQSPAGGIAALTYGAREADARLIAAAPDLLAALERALPWLIKAEIDGAFARCAAPLGGKRAIERMQAAITKATGA